MIIFLSILFSVIAYIVGAGATHGYAKHHWAEKLESVWDYRVSKYVKEDQSEKIRTAAAILWPLYWVFIWPFTKTNEVTFSHIEKNAALQIAKNKTRIDDLHATKTQLEASNQELENAEVELEKEMAKL